MLLPSLLVASSPKIPGLRPFLHEGAIRPSFNCAHRAINKMLPPSLLICRSLQMTEFTTQPSGRVVWVGATLRASNEGLLRPRVARARAATQDSITFQCSLQARSLLPFPKIAELWLFPHEGAIRLSFNCAHRASTFRSAGSASKKDGLIAPSPDYSLSLPLWNFSSSTLAFLHTLPPSAPLLRP